MPWGRLLPFLLQKVLAIFAISFVFSHKTNLLEPPRRVPFQLIVDGKTANNILPQARDNFEGWWCLTFLGTLGWRLVMFWTSPFEHDYNQEWFSTSILMFWGCNLEKRTRNWPRNTWPDREARLLCRPQRGHGAREFHGPTHWPCVKGLSPKPVTSWNQFPKGKQRPKPVPEHRWEIWDV